MMISMDNPEHQRRRSLVYHGFTPKRVAEHEARIRVICNEIIDRVCERGECDFVWDVAAPLPLLLIADMLGFEPSAYDDLLRWSDDLIRATTADPDPEVARGVDGGELGFRELQLGVIADRRSKPQQSDLISLLCHSEVDGERLDDESIVQETLLILIGGDETTRHVITGGQLALFDAPRPARHHARRTGGAADRRRGDAAVGVADQEHVAHRGARRRAARARRCTRVIS